VTSSNLAQHCWSILGKVGGVETSGMQSRFVLSRKPNRRGVASRLASAILFFLLGAITATALYPHADADRHSEDSSISDSRHVAALTPAPDAISDRSSAFASRDGAEYTGGPIPKPTFAAPQPVVAAAAIEAQALTDEGHSASAANVGRPDQTGNKAIRKKEYGHRRNETQNRPYREQPSDGAVQRYWNPWGWGNQFERPGRLATWR
jgi:hypothetical protein